MAYQPCPGGKLEFFKGEQRKIWDLGIKPDSEKITGLIVKIVDTSRLWEK
jgi:hypothetical protein